MLDRISMATMRPFTQKVNQVQEDCPLSGLCPAEEGVPSVSTSGELDLERPGDMLDVDLPPPLPFESGDADGAAAPFSLYGALTSAFVSTDLLSYFTDT